MNSVTRQFPQYAILMNYENGEAQIARYRFQRENKVFSKLITLPFAPEYIKETDDLLWTYDDVVDNCVSIYTKSERPEKIADIDLRDVGYDSVDLVHIIE